MQARALAVTLLDYICLSIPFVISPCLLCAAIHVRTAYLLTFPFMATRQMPTHETFVLDSLSPKTYKIHLYVSPTPLLYSFQATGLYLLLYDFFPSVFVSPFETELLFASC